ncbi:hypothetical protein Ciccas_010106 [Cichlidogyrus casuarinus]|uniref:Uncharacterized protein n=1 Tax=Cichlidogyrus casuarinus TaxID=1844966 RepID=A0ABD2PVD2_9PLAT
MKGDKAYFSPDSLERTNSLIIEDDPRPFPKNSSNNPNESEQSTIHPQIPKKIGHVPILGDSIEVYSTDLTGVIKYDPEGFVIRKRRISYGKLPKEEKKRVLSGLILKSAIHHSLSLTTSSSDSSRKMSFIDPLNVDVNFMNQQESEMVADEVLETASVDSSLAGGNCKSVPKLNSFALEDPLSMIEAVEAVVSEDSLLKRGNGPVVEFLEPNDPFEYFSRRGSFNPEEMNDLVATPKEVEKKTLSNQLVEFPAENNLSKSTGSFVVKSKTRPLYRHPNWMPEKNQINSEGKSEPHEEKQTFLANTMLAPKTELQLPTGIRKGNLSKAKYNKSKADMNKRK